MNRKIREENPRLDPLTHGIDPADLIMKGVHNLLRACGFRNRSGSWEDYEKAKGLIIGTHEIDPRVYSRIVGWITTYLNL